MGIDGIDDVPGTDSGFLVFFNADFLGFFQPQ
jgi:hypothetical protein